MTAATRWLRPPRATGGCGSLSTCEAMAIGTTKSTPEQIRRRFDNDVERFANLQTGRSATVGAPLVLDLIAEAAAATTPDARAVLDVGCGAGNYTLKLLDRLS